MRSLIKTIIVISLVTFLPLTASAALPGFMLKRMGALKGQVFVEEKPLPGAIIAFFLESKGLPPIGEGMRRVPEFLTRANPEGNFTVKLAAGKYYIGILIREDKAPGPPREGEKFYFADNGQGKLRLFSIADHQKIDVGRVDGSDPAIFKEIENLFSIEGIVMKGNLGEPYKGAVVMAKTALNNPRPDYISKRTLADGKFKLSVGPDSSYFLIARETISVARPRPGDYLGTYGVRSEGSGNVGLIFGSGAPPPGVMNAGEKPVDKPLQVIGGTGESLTGVEIMVFQVPDPQVIKESLQGTVGSPKFESGAKLDNILFATNSHQLEESSIPELDRWVEFLKGRVDITIELGGHTDSVGDETYNQQLSKKRAKEIAKYLINNGIDVLRIVAAGFGESKPVADNSTAEGRQRNRRVEIKFSK